MVHLRHSPAPFFILAIVVLLSGSAQAQMPPAAGQGMPPTGGQPSGMPAMGQQPSGMPDARMMSGIPMPMGDLPDGTVSVRVVRGEISNALPKQSVELVVNGETRTMPTDEAGRAQFSGLTAGGNAKAAVTVDGERIESQPFTIPEKGGVRLMLTASGAAAPAAPAVAGNVTFGSDSRIAIEFDDDTLSIFYILDVVNKGAAPVNPASPVVLDLPSGAVGASLLEGSSPQAKVAGNRLSIAGPFNPGRTTVQLGYQLPPAGGSTTIVQPFPAALDGFVVAVQQTGDVRLQSAQIAQQQTVRAEGRMFVLGNGPALAARTPLVLELSGLPHRPAWPRDVAVAVAIAVLAAGFWFAFGREDGAVARRRELEGQRERLFADLLALEQARRAGALDAEAYAAQRGELMRTLERIYGELDSAAPAGPRQGTPGGGDRGLAA